MDHPIGLDARWANLIAESLENRSESLVLKHHAPVGAPLRIRVVLERVMREELDALIGVGWGESSPQRRGYRNGSYWRDLLTTSSRIEDLKVPRDREGQFHTQIFERFSRRCPKG